MSWQTRQTIIQNFYSVFQSNYPKPAEMSPDLTTRETLTLLGGVFLFITFFVAMYAAGTAEQSPSQVGYSIRFSVLAPT